MGLEEREAGIGGDGVEVEVPGFLGGEVGGGGVEVVGADGDERGVLG